MYFGFVSHWGGSFEVCALFQLIRIGFELVSPRVRISSSEASSQESEWPRLRGGTRTSCPCFRVQCFNINIYKSNSYSTTTPSSSKTTLSCCTKNELPLSYHQKSSFLKHALKCGKPGEGTPARRFLPKHHPSYHLISENYHRQLGGSHHQLLPSFFAVDDEEEVDNFIKVTARR